MGSIIIKLTFVVLLAVGLIISSQARDVYSAGSGSQSTQSSSSQQSMSDNRYNYNNLWNLFMQDVLRWFNIIEDITAESLQKQFFEGIIDKKTIKLGLRFVAQKMYNTMQEQGMISQEFRNIQFLRK